MKKIVLIGSIVALVFSGATFAKGPGYHHRYFNDMNHVQYNMNHGDSGADKQMKTLHVNNMRGKCQYYSHNQYGHNKKHKQFYQQGKNNRQYYHGGFIDRK